MITRKNLEAAREAALSALGRTGETTLARLEAAGLTVVRTADLPEQRGAGVRTLTGVQLRTPANWAAPWPVTVIAPDGETLHLHVLRAAHTQVAEAVHLQEVMGHALDVEVDTDSELLIRATAVSR